jgi:hypothetical protein
MKQNGSLTLQRKKRKIEDVNNNNNNNDANTIYNPLKEELPTHGNDNSVGNIGYSISTNKNLIKSVTRFQINGRNERNGRQLVTNKINDKGFAYSR